MPQPLASEIDRPDIDVPSAEDLEQEHRLADWFRERESALIGFSGGVDSAYLACVAVDALGGTRVLGVIGRSASYPAEQWARAREVAERFGVPVLEVVTDEVSDPRYAANPSNRCYFCKSELWDTLGPLARERGLAVVVDGTNADDRADHRPGARAAAEHDVQSPLALLGFTKAAIRRLSRARGIPTWAQPASPCLSSRIPYGTAVTVDRLRQIEHAERALREVGVTGDLRVRYHGDLARIELAGDALDAWLAPAARGVLREAVRGAGFDRVALDLRGFRSGSLNVLGGVVAEPLVRARPSSDGGAADSNAEGNAEGNADGLARAVGELGLECSIEARERLAVVQSSGGRETVLRIDPALRRSVIDAARRQGFTHVALELRDGGDDAALRRR